jgi:phage shock protein C
MRTINQTKPLQWVRSKDGKIAGVCEGLAKVFEIEPWVMRACFIALTLFVGFGISVYIAMAIAMPHEDNLNNAYEARILGVCGRLAKRYNMEVGIVRLAALALIAPTGASVIVFYFILHFLVPKDDSNK